MKMKQDNPRKPISFHASLACVALLGAAGFCFSTAEGAESSPLIKIDDTISAVPGGRVGNLEIFALVGPDQIAARKYLTLAEAMDQKLVRVQETKSVNQLRIENISVDQYVFIQAGDIVKGGQQDRCLGMDLLLPPKSGPQAIGSFCVEHGRWTGRTGESAEVFSKSDKLLVTTKQRYAVKSARQQSAVWSEVDNSKKALSGNAGKLSGKKIDVEANVSPSSLQLALENKDLSETIQKTRQELNSNLPRRNDLIGVAYAINGKLVNAEIYGNAQLFGKLRNKILEAAVTESITELKDPSAVPPAVAETDLRKFLRADGVAKPRASRPNSQTEWRHQEESDRAIFESRDADFANATCHRNVILADDSVKSAVRGNSSSR